ncbi:hypothetical protein M6B38_268855 [Iris pallida]|uniref:Uncharacterized protein n=1 Tax=Iris pallida TaxID=29817 RepID=A0AAX6HIB6_IRIPA|nr:hypothetical protein M6B38_118570 [Iris pallida]KAJ6849921.1 hypothetical protein M6B38_268855 [Iris pallida]
MLQVSWRLSVTLITGRSLEAPMSQSMLLWT